jgi:hypothetical protein
MPALELPLLLLRMELIELRTLELPPLTLTLPALLSR